MSLPKSKVIEAIEADTYPARIVQIIDLGMQPQTDFETGEEKPDRPEVYITFELPDELIEVNGEDKPRWLSKRYKLSMSQNGHIYINERSALATLIEACGFKKHGFFDVTQLIGVACLVEVGVTGNGHNKIVKVSKVPKKYPEIPELYNNPVVFDKDDPDMEAFEKFPKWLKDLIYKPTEEETDDGENLPF